MDGDRLVIGVHHTQPVIGGQSLLGTLASLVTGGAADHVEVMLVEACSDELTRQHRGVTCSTCKMKLSRPGGAQTNASPFTGVHTRRYTVTQTKPLSVMLDDPHPPYRANTWISYSVPLAPGSLRSVQSFLDGQLGATFNAQGLWWNFMPGQTVWSWLGRTSGLTEVYQTHEMLQACRPRSWFCSELVCAVLNGASAEWRRLGLVPAYTSPQRLEHALRREMPSVREMPVGATFANLAEHFRVMPRCIDIRMQR